MVRISLHFKDWELWYYICTYHVSIYFKMIICSFTGRSVGFLSCCIRSPQKTTTTGPQGEHLFQDVLRNCFGLRVYEHVVVSSGSIMLRGKNQDHETNIIKSSTSASSSTTTTSSSSSSKSRSKTSCFSNPGTHLWLFLQSEPRPLASWTPLTSEMPALAMSGR